MRHFLWIAIILIICARDISAALSAPVALAASANTPTGFTANWDHSIGATGDILDITTSGGDPVQRHSNLDVGYTTSCVVTGLHVYGLTVFNYRVRAYDLSGTSAASRAVSTTILPPEAPTLGAPTSVAHAGFTVGWSVPAGGFAYTVDVSTNSDFRDFVVFYQRSNTNGAVIGGLREGTRYFVRVQAHNGSPGPFSDYRSVTTRKALDAEFERSSIGATVVSLQPDGKVLLGGTTVEVDGRMRRLVRLNTDGTLDESFRADVGVVFDTSIQALALQADGKMVVGGRFSGLNDNNIKNVVRLNRDGSVDPGFAGPEASIVHCVEILADGRIVIAGSFNYVGDQTFPGLARLLPNGEVEKSFPVERRHSFASYAMAALPDGKLLIGRTNGLVRLNVDGSLDSQFNAPINFTVRGILLRPHGKILVVGGPSGAIQLNADGTPDTAFRTEVPCDKAWLAPEGKLIVRIANSPARGILINRLNADGSLDASFPAPGPALAIAHDLAVRKDGRIVVAGVELNDGGNSPFCAQILGYPGGSEPVHLSISSAEDSISLSSGGNGFYLESAASAEGPFNYVAHESPGPIPKSGLRRFFRLRED